jgi:hypothetical protein
LISSDSADEVVERRLASPRATRDFKQQALSARRLLRARGRGRGRPAKLPRAAAAVERPGEDAAQDEDAEQEGGEEDEEEEEEERASDHAVQPGRRGRGKASGRVRGRGGRGQQPTREFGEPGGWRVLVFQRHSGSQAGKTYKYWMAPDGTRHRSIPSARRAGFTG